MRMAQFDRNALLQYHQQAITHALAPQQSAKQMPCQLVFPDDTMTVGAPAVSRGGNALFPTDSGEGTQETEEDRQRRLLQNEPIVVYTSLSPTEALRPGIVRRGLALLLVAAIQSVCIVVDLTGGADETVFEPIGPTPSESKDVVYVAQLCLQLLYMISMCFSSPDLLMVYITLSTLVGVLIATLVLRTMLDVFICALSLPLIALASSLRDLMMPHCFIVRS